MTYTYRCDGCAQEFELEQRITDAPKRKCPACGRFKLRRLISGGGAFALVGRGWAADGYS